MRKQVIASISYLEKYLESTVAPRPPTATHKNPSDPIIDDPGHSPNNVASSHAYKPCTPWSQASSTNGHHDAYKNSAGRFQSSNPYHVVQHGYPIPSHANPYQAVSSPYLPAPYSTQPAPQRSYQYPPGGSAVQYLDANIYDVGPQSWNQFTQSLPNMQAYDPANTLLQLSGQGQMVKAEGMGEQDSGVGTVGLEPAQMWPWALLGQPP